MYLEIENMARIQINISFKGSKYIATVHDPIGKSFTVDQSSINDINCN